MLLAASRVRRLALADNADFTRENTQALDAAVKGHINVVLNVQQTRDLSAINYAQQGNAAMYTPEVMSKRHSNRTDTRLIEVVRHWWRWLPKAEQELMEVAPAAPPPKSAAVKSLPPSAQPTAAAGAADALCGAGTAAGAGAEAGAEGDGGDGTEEGRKLQARGSLHTRLDGGSGGVALEPATGAGTGEGEGAGTPGDGAGAGGGGSDIGAAPAAVLKVAALDRPIYSAMVVAITMVLLPRFGLKADPDYDPSEDWLDDNKGLPYMDFPNFFDAMFELADMWAEGTDVREYVELLLTTLHDVQKMDAADGAFSRLLKKFGYKPAFNPPRDSLYPPEPEPAPPPPQPPPTPPQARAPSPEPEPSRPGRLIPQHAPIRTEHVTSRVANHIRSFRSFRERSEQASANWEGWGGAAGGTGGGGAGVGEEPQPRQPPHPNAHMFSYGGGNHSSGRGPLPGSPPPDYSGVGGSGYGAARAGSGSGWSPRRRGPFVMPAPAKADYSGIRSTLAELTSAPRRPDAATLEEWRRMRRQRQQQRLASARLGGKEQGVGGVPLLLRQAEVADPGVAAPGGPGAGCGPSVHMYQEYMHDMAARYLTAQEALLVATSAAAAAAAEQVLAAAGWAQQQQPQEAVDEFGASGYHHPQLWDSADVDPAVTGGGAGRAVAEPPAAISPRLPVLSASASGQQVWPPRASGAGVGGSVGPSPQASPRTFGTVPTSTAPGSAAASQDAAPDAPAAAPACSIAASPSGSATGVLASRASRLGSRALLSGGASSHSLPATPRGGVSITVGPDTSGPGGGGGAAGVLTPPPPLPQLWGPPLDPQAQITAITGRPAPAPASSPGAAQAVPASAVSALAAATLASEGSGASLAPSASVASTARSPLSRRGPGGEPAESAVPTAFRMSAETAVDAGASPVPPPTSAHQTASSDAEMGTGMGPGGRGGGGGGGMAVDTAAAAAQAEVVVAFAQAAYRLADPNVHALLLPSRGQPGAGPHFPAHTAGARGYSGRRFSPQRAVSPSGAPGSLAAPDTGARSSGPGGRPRCGSSRAARPAVAEGRERFAAYLQAPGAAAAAAARYGHGVPARPGTAGCESGGGAEGWGWAPGPENGGPDAAAGAGGTSWSCDGVEGGGAGAGAGSLQPAAGYLSGAPSALYRAATADVGSLPVPLSRRPGTSPTPGYWFRPGHVAASSSERAANTAVALLGGGAAGVGAGPAGGSGGDMLLPVGRTASGSNWFSVVPQLRLPDSGSGSVMTGGSATAPCSPHSATAPDGGGTMGLLASGSPSALSPSGAAGAGQAFGGSPATQRRGGMLGTRPGGDGGVWGHGNGRMSARGGGGVVMPHGAMSNKLRTFYTTAPTGVVMPDGQVMVPPPGHTSCAAAAAAAESGATAADGACGDEGPEASPAAAGAAGRRQRSGPVPTPVPSAVAAAAADAAAQRGALRSPLRIRSSEPVGFSDAVTAARLNVTLMADELAARLAEQRAAERQHRLAAVGLLRPPQGQGPGQGLPEGSGAPRSRGEAVRSSFSAFMAARETAAAGGPTAEVTETGSASGEGYAAVGQ
ncbi:hypothetical protein HYH02_006539 [Chlamydomonas schloesseri]|uniref:Uncharacterized protein n=1 Tax=Chlamydomonas schloesseri TaxID=2026947 RepID=A0A835TJS2_9CHLO|nr:hypothetical protein HYH02_006539 [Chlamydomonas schloesseri]|eukprot:KAG2439010.1 hypothetical protein HYH02_006539 [Chlamydomonas schloesseri]